MSRSTFCAGTPQAMLVLGFKTEVLSDVGGLSQAVKRRQLAAVRFCYWVATNSFHAATIRPGNGSAPGDIVET